MTAEIISFTQHRTMARQMARQPQFSQKPKNMRSLSFRSRAVVLEIDERILLEDVRFAFEKAERKHDALRRHLENYKKRAAKEIQQLTMMEAKLGAAIEAARTGR
jgi:hypothetical protein